MPVSLSNIVRCPRCAAPIASLESRPICTNPACLYSREGFERVGNQPVLIDFDRSIFSRPRDTDAMPSVLPRDDARNSFHSRFWDVVEGKNPTSVNMSRAMLRAMMTLSEEPTLLIIGGGAVGAGVEIFLKEKSLQVISTDVYASANTQLLTDAHSLPFIDSVFDGVWITAVLEHVLEPQVVVDEIWRVLKPAGLVYAETPFMQQVHEQAFDFSRFTANGHRWLFRRFEQNAAGVNRGSGPRHALAWSARYFVRAFCGNRIGTLATIPLFSLRFLDDFARPRSRADAALGFFFSDGRRSVHSTRRTCSPITSRN